MAGKGDYGMFFQNLAVVARLSDPDLLIGRPRCLESGRGDDERRISVRRGFREMVIHS